MSCYDEEFTEFYDFHYDDIEYYEEYYEEDYDEYDSFEPDVIFYENEDSFYNTCDNYEDYEYYDDEYYDDDI